MSDLYQAPDGKGYPIEHDWLDEDEQESQVCWKCHTKRRRPPGLPERPSISAPGHEGGTVAAHARSHDLERLLSGVQGATQQDGDVERSMILMNTNAMIDEAVEKRVKECSNNWAFGARRLGFPGKDPKPEKQPHLPLR